MAKNRDATSGISRASLVCRLTNPETYEAEKEIFNHLEKETDNFLPIYLKSELLYLHNRELFGDGTWSLCRNLPNRMQVYIFSVSMNQLGKTFSYPVFLMKKREKTLQ